MAMKIEFTGWMNDRKDFSWGTVIKATHSVRRKDEAGEWQTVGKDYVDIVIEDSKRAEFAHILDAPVPCRIEVAGNVKPSHYEKRGDNGPEIVNYLKVWPDNIEVMQQDFTPSNAQPQDLSYLSDTPF